jgi:hypothetical protein
LWHWTQGDKPFVKIRVADGVVQIIELVDLRRRAVIDQMVASAFFKREDRFSGGTKKPAAEAAAS